MKASAAGKAGERCSSYLLVEHLGGGANADVWRADGPQGAVAIKLPRSRNFTSEPYRRFVREVTQLRERGDASGVLPLLDAYLPTQGSSRSRAWLVTPMATPLRDALASQEATAEQIVEAVAQLAETLASLAALGVSQRDIKPDNLYVYDGRVVAVDFGLVDGPNVAPLTVAGASVGPMHFMAPEMVRDASTADGRIADVYSLGKTFWVLLAQQNFPPPGEHRLDEPSLLLSSYVAHHRVSSLDALVSRMTRHSTLERPRMAHVAAELRAWLRPAAAPAGASVDLSQIAQRVTAASEGTRTEAQALETRRDAVSTGVDTVRAVG